MPPSLAGTLQDRIMSATPRIQGWHMNALQRLWHDTRNMLQFLARLFQWILVKPRLFWLTILVPVLMSVWAIHEGNEPAFRLIGLLLQIAGTATVILNIRSARRQFQRPSFFKLVEEW